MNRPPEVRLHRSLTKGLKLFDADRLRWLDEAAALGPVVPLRMGPVKTWVVTDAGAARTMLVTDDASWMRPPATVAPIRVGVGENLFTQSNKKWALLQPHVAPAFRKKALEARLAEMRTLIDEEVCAIPLDQTTDLDLAMGRIALILAAWVLLGERLDRGRAEEIASHQREVVRWVGDRLGQLSGFIPVAMSARAQVMKQHRAALNAYADEVIARAKGRAPSSDDVLGALMTARPAGRMLAPNELRGHVLGLFLAGNETTGAALSWALVHGSENPTAWAQLRESEGATSAFLDESLRLTPAVWGVPRAPSQAGVTITASGVSTRVRRGQLATVYLRGINRDPKIWSDPMRFDPSRHDAALKEQQRALLPFGLGPRGCIGQHLAMAEMAAVLPALARRGDVTIDGTVTEDAGFALRIAGGLRGRLTTPH